MKKELQQLISQGKTEQAIDQLLRLTERSGNPELREEVLMQSARYRDYAKAKRLGTSSAESQQTAIARINQALLQISEQLPEDSGGDGGGDSRAKPRKTKAWQWVAGAGVIVSILSGIAGFTGVNLKDIFGMGETNNPLQLTVYVHGPDGRQDVVLENEGQLLLDLRNDRRVAQIGEYGRTNFGEISRDFLRKAVPLSVQAEGYEMAHPDSNYVYDGEPIYLEVRKDKRLGLITGMVTDEKGRGLAGATILIENDTTASTDSIGRFRLRMPFDRIEESYQLTIQKEGYQSKTRTYYPNSNLFKLELERTKNQ